MTFIFICKTTESSMIDFKGNFNYFHTLFFVSVHIYGTSCTLKPDLLPTISFGWIKTKRKLLVCLILSYCLPEWRRKETRECCGLDLEQSAGGRHALNVRDILFERRYNDNNTMLQHTLPVRVLHLITFKQHKWGVKPEPHFHTGGLKNKRDSELSVNIFNQTIAA